MTMQVAGRNETEMRHRGGGTARNETAGLGTQFRGKTEDLALDRAIPGTARNTKECARRESNPRPSA